LALSLSVACAAGVAGAVPLLAGFGGPTGYGLPEHCLHPSDDGSYAGDAAHDGLPAVPVDLTPAFPFGLRYFGVEYRAMYVNTNGNVSFLGPLPTYTPAPFPVAMQPMIAPWWGDVDTRGGGQPARNNICFHLEPGRVVVTWNNVGHFAAHDELLNDFQLVLTSPNLCRSTGDFDVEFRYNRCEWSTGDGGSGAIGPRARAGRLRRGQPPQLRGAPDVAHQGHRGGVPPLQRARRPARPLALSGPRQRHPRGLRGRRRPLRGPRAPRRLRRGRECVR